jgi:hypothetical protein
VPITVPAGKVLIVDHITASVFSSPGQDIVFPVFIVQNGTVSAIHVFPAQPLGAASNTQQFYLTSVDPKLYVPAGYQLQASIARNNAPNSSFPALSSGMNISGRLVDAQ